MENDGKKVVKNAKKTDSEIEENTFWPSTKVMAQHCKKWADMLSYFRFQNEKIKMLETKYEGLTVYPF